MSRPVELRKATRKKLDLVEVSYIATLENFVVLARGGRIVDASSTGLLIVVDRADLLPKSLKSNLTLEAIVGERVILEITAMELDIEGKIVRTQHIGKGSHEIAIDFSDTVPEYWRECLYELLPIPGEF